jgi:hypothetical protein
MQARADLSTAVRSRALTVPKQAAASWPRSQWGHHQQQQQQQRQERLHLLLAVCKPPILSWLPACMVPLARRSHSGWSNQARS